MHAVPGESENNIDTVKFEPIGAYLQSDRCVKAKIVRVPCKAYIAQKAVEYALSKIGFPFDNDFDLADTTKFLLYRIGMASLSFCWNRYI